MNILSLLKKMLVVAGFGGAAVASASFYPPDYVVDSECRSDGPVTVCMYNRFNQKPYLRIEYGGDLMSQHWGRINAWVRINGRDAMFAMTNSNYSEIVSINHARDIQLCYFNSTMEIQPGPHAHYCPDATPERPRSFGWWSQQPPAHERELVGSANDGRHDSGWWIDLAFFASDGSWDSRNGANYHVQFSRSPY